MGLDFWTRGTGSEFSVLVDPDGDQVAFEYYYFGLWSIMHKMKTTDRFVNR